MERTTCTATRFSSGFSPSVLIGSALAVILARNPVHSVLFLILAFVAAAGLFLLLGAEFLGMILIVVYVGAVAVLFLFVVMMLDVDFAELKQGFLQYLPIGGADRALSSRSSSAMSPSAGRARRTPPPPPRRPARSPTPRRSGACSTRNISISSRRRA